MCYEFSGWFLKARAKEIHKARDKPGAVETKAAAPAASKPAVPQAKEPEKIPA